MTRIPRFALFGSVVALMLSPMAHATDYILCHRDAEITPVNPEPTDEDDPCSGHVLLQGISYECTPQDEVDSKRSEFLEALKRGGKEYCSDYCKKRSTKTVKCRGVFEEPFKCGFTVPTHEAAHFGKDKAPCRPSCRGTSFAYCSIYHGGFLRVEADQFKDKRPNCRCEKSRR